MMKWFALVVILLVAPLCCLALEFSLEPKKDGSLTWDELGHADLMTPLAPDAQCDESDPNSVGTPTGGQFEVDFENADPKKIEFMFRIPPGKKIVFETATTKKVLLKFLAERTPTTNEETFGPFSKETEPEVSEVFLVDEFAEATIFVSTNEIRGLVAMDMSGITCDKFYLAGSIKWGVDYDDVDIDASGMKTYQFDACNSYLGAFDENDQPAKGLPSSLVDCASEGCEKGTGRYLVDGDDAEECIFHTGSTKMPSSAGVTCAARFWAFLVMVSGVVITIW